VKFLLPLLSFQQITVNTIQRQRLCRCAAVASSQQDGGEDSRRKLLDRAH
jgi:hypothetical protein